MIIKQFNYLKVLADIDFLWHPIHKVTDNITSFYHPLEEFIQNAEINPKTGNKLIILVIVSDGYVNIAQNYYCSLNFVGEMSKYALFITGNAETRDKLRTLGAKTCFIPTLISKYKRKMWHLMGHLRLIFLEYLLKRGIEVILCDSDMVFFRNPFEILDYSQDFVISAEMSISNWNGYYLPWKINMGFIYFHNIKKCYQFIKDYNMILFNVAKKWDQRTLHNYLMSGNLTKLDNWKVLDIIRGERYNYQVISPIQIIHLLTYLKRNEVISDITSQNLTIPYALHLAWFDSYRKEFVEPDVQNKFALMSKYMNFLSPDFKKCVSHDEFSWSQLTSFLNQKHAAHTQ